MRHELKVIFMKQAYLIFCFLNLFLAENLLLYLHITNFSAINNFLLAFASFLLMVKYFYHQQGYVSGSKYFFVLVVVQVLFFLLTGNEGFKSSLCFAPILVISAFPKKSVQKKDLWRILFFMFLFFYISECSLAVVERVLSKNLPILRADSVFEGMNNVEADLSFRSEALLGHPLQNALVVSSAMSFILCSRMGVVWKFSLWGLGFLAILCFNTRFAIINSMFFLLVYLCNISRWHLSFREKRKLYLLSFFFSFIVLILFFKVGVADRLMNMGLLDSSSSSARLKLFDIFINVDYTMFLLPLDPGVQSSLMAYWKIPIIENFWILYLFGFGAIFLLFAIFIYYKLLKNMYRTYSRFAALFTFLCFIITASTNNSLATSWHMLFYYLFFILVFDPLMELFVMPSFMQSDRAKVLTSIFVHRILVYRNLNTDWEEKSDDGKE